MPLLIKHSCPASFIGYLMIMLFSLCPLNSRAQADCSKTLQEASNLYDLGMIDEIPKMLGPCMQEGFTRPQKIEAYKLMVLAYLFDNDQFDAEKTMQEFLKKYPEYEIMPNDPVEFIHLFDTYRTTAEFSIGVIAGLNLTNPRILQPYSMLDKAAAAYSNSTLPGYSFGIGVGRYLGKRLMLNIELQLARQKFSFTDKDTLTRQDGTKVNDSYKFEEDLKKIEMPVTVTYEINKGKLRYFIRAGGSANYIFSDMGMPSSVINKQSFSGEHTDMREYRNSIYFNALAGFGLHYKIPRGYLSLDVRYSYGINNIVKTDKRFDNPYLSSSQFQYLDDDFNLHTYTVKIGYYLSFYNPKKTK